MKEDPPRAKAELLLHLTREVRRVAGSLAQLSTGAGEAFGNDRPSSNSNAPEVAIEQVKWLIRARRNRALYLPAELFADPAWDILLDLLRAELAFERISVSSACIGADVPATTALRSLKGLEEQGLVVRQDDPRDARRSFVSLSRETSNALRRYFHEVVATLHVNGNG